MARKSSLFQSSERFVALEEVLSWLEEVLKWLEEVLKWLEEVLNLFTFQFLRECFFSAYY